LETVEGPALDHLARPASLALANLPWAVMGDLLSDPAPLAGKRDLIISGITRSHVGALRDSLVRLGYNIIEERRADDTWFSVWAG
jgi:ribosomal protein L11 methyltransferase